jgi:OOP family OmpA-OmpF porin
MRTLLFGTVLVAQAFVIVLLTGCGATFDYAALRNSEAQGEDFTAELARKYKSFALFETDEMRDWPDAAHFGGKALAAASGKAPAPEKLRDWRLPKDKLGEITAARVRLVAALDKGAGERLPREAAEAQVDFDCWVEQQEENWQFDHIAKCRDGFHAAIAEIDKAFAVSEAAADTNAIPAVAIRGEAGDEAEEPTGYLILFDFDSADIKADSIDALDAIAAAAKGGDTVRLIVSGHTDTAGPKSFNQRLSWQRAEAVSAALIGRGVPSDRIGISAHGERRPRISTPDGVREPRNRRVEITVGPSPAL